MINTTNKIRITRHYASLKKEPKVFNFTGIRMFTSHGDISLLDMAHCTFHAQENDGA